MHLSRRRLPKLKITLALACFAGCVAWSPTSSALIVWEGQVVREWPDQPVHATFGPGVAAAQLPIGTYPSPKGEVWGLTIVVDFSDVAPAFTLDEIDAWLNQPGYSAGGINGSVRDYFWDNSRGQVEFRNEVVGFVRAAKPKSYYEGGNGYERAEELVAELLDAVDDEVDFSKFDNDGDGRTEAISIVYAGPQETFAQGLWPHSGGLRETRDGVQLTRYQMSQMGNSLGLYTIAHEVGHMLFGWPDLYGFGNYCIMGNSSDMKNPVGINDFYRADQGWIPVTDIDSSTNKRYYAVPDAGGYRYVNPERPDEVFFWSNVQATNRWSTLRGSGLVLLHFDYAIRTNNPPNPLSLAVVQADGLRELDQTQWPSPGSDAEDFFTAETKSEFSSDTTPASLWNDGSESDLRIYEISANGPEMTFAVGHGTPDPGVAGAGGAGGVGGAASQTAATGTGSGGIGGSMGSTSMTGTTGTADTASGGAVNGTASTGSITGGAATSGIGTADSGTVMGPTSTIGAGGVGMNTMTSATVSGSVGGAAAFTNSAAGGDVMAPPAEDAAGCACRLDPASSNHRAWLFGGLASLLFMRRRRRWAKVTFMRLQGSRQ